MQIFYNPNTRVHYVWSWTLNYFHCWNKIPLAKVADKYSSRYTLAKIIFLFVIGRSLLLLKISSPAITRPYRSINKKQTNKNSKMQIPRRGWYKEPWPWKEASSYFAATVPLNIKTKGNKRKEGKRREWRTKVRSLLRCSTTSQKESSFLLGLSPSAQGEVVALFIASRSRKMGQDNYVLGQFSFLELLITFFRTILHNLCRRARRMFLSTFLIKPSHSWISSRFTLYLCLRPSLTFDNSDIFFNHPFRFIFSFRFFFTRFVLLCYFIVS